MWQGVRRRVVGREQAVGWQRARRLLVGRKPVEWRLGPRQPVAHSAVAWEPAARLTVQHSPGDIRPRASPVPLLVPGRPHPADGRPLAREGIAALPAMRPARTGRTLRSQCRGARSGCPVSECRRNSGQPRTGWVREEISMAAAVGGERGRVLCRRSRWRGLWCRASVARVRWLVVGRRRQWVGAGSCGCRDVDSRCLVMRGRRWQGAVRPGGGGRAWRGRARRPCGDRRAGRGAALRRQWSAEGVWSRGGRRDVCPRHSRLRYRGSPVAVSPHGHRWSSCCAHGTRRLPARSDARRVPLLSRRVFAWTRGSGAAHDRVRGWRRPRAGSPQGQR